MVFEACRSSPFTLRRYLDGERYSRAGARDKRAARASRTRDYSSAFRFRCVRGTGAGACVVARRWRSAHAQSQSRHDHRRRQVVRSDEPWREHSTLEGAERRGAPQPVERALLIFCHCKLIYSMGPGIIPCGPRIVRALWGPDTFHTQPSSPWSARSLFALALPPSYSVLASPRSAQAGGCLRRSSAHRRSVPLRHVTRIVVPFFTRWIGCPSFRAHRGRSAVKISLSSASRCDVLRFAAPKLIARPREHRRSFIARPKNSFDEILRLSTENGIYSRGLRQRLEV